MSRPQTRVEIAFGSQQADLAPTYTDITDYTRNAEGISITKWRSDEIAEVDPLMAQICVNNGTGVFTPKRNAIRNPTFKTNATGWRAVGTSAAVARTTSQFITSPASLQITAGSGGGDHGAATTGTGTAGIPVLEVCSYFVSAWFMAATTGRNCRVQVVCYDSAGTTLSTLDSTAVADVTSDWTQVTYAFTTPQRCAFVDVRFLVASPAVSEVHYLDEAKMLCTGINRGNHLRIHANLLKDGDNGTFESSTIPAWVVSNASVARTTAQARYGTASYQITATTAAHAYIANPSFIPINPGVKYLVSGWFRPATTARSCSINIYWYNSVGALLGSNALFANTTEVLGTWTRAEGTIVCPFSNAVYALIQPQIISPAAGEVHYIDHVELSVPRFTGFLQDTLVEWPDLVEASTKTTISAASFTAWVDRKVTLRTLPEEELSRMSNLKAYYPLIGDGLRSQSIGDKTVTDLLDLTVVTNGNKVSFGDPPFPVTDEANMSKYDDGSTLSLAPRNTIIRSMAFVINTTATIVEYFWGRFASFEVGGQQSHTTLRAKLQADGTFMLSKDSWSTALGDTFEEQSSGPPLNDGLPHTIVMTDLDTSPKVYLDGVLQGIVLSQLGIGDENDEMWFGGAMGAANTGLFLEANRFTGYLGRVAMFTSNLTQAEVTQYDNAIRTGFAGETAGARMARYANYGAIPASRTDFDAGVVTDLSNIEISGMSALEAMRAVEETEGGEVFDDVFGILRFESRSVRYTATPLFSASVASGEIIGAFSEQMDDQVIENEVSATNYLGVEAVVTDATSVAQIGYYRSEKELFTTDPDEPALAASWAVQQNSVPENRLQGIPFLLNNISDALAVGVLNAEIGTKFTLTDLPNNAHESELSLFVEGVEEQITATSHVVMFYTSPAEQWDIFTFDDPIMGRLDGDYSLGY